MSKRGAPERGRRIGLRTVRLPADERGAGQVVRTLLQGRYGVARAAQLLAQLFPLLPAQGRVTRGLRQQTTEAGQDDDALLQGRELGGGERRIRGDVRADECRQVGGRFHAPLRRLARNRLVVPWPQADGDAVGRWRRRFDPPGWRAVQVQQRANADQGEGGFGHAPTGGQLGEATFLIRGRARRDRRHAPWPDAVAHHVCVRRAHRRL